MHEDLNITAARDTANAISSQRTAHAVVNAALTSEPNEPCRCSLCAKGETIRQGASSGERRPFQWTIASLGRDAKFPATYFCYMTPASGVSVRVSGKDPREVIRIANQIEALEAKR
jgi:hypothetical protein